MSERSPLVSSNQQYSTNSANGSLGDVETGPSSGVLGTNKENQYYNSQDMATQESQERRGNVFYRAPKKKKEKLLMARISGLLGVILFLFSLCAGSAFFGIYFGLDKLMDAGIRDQIVISPNAETYERWITNTDFPLAQYDAVTMYNLTNAYDVVTKGAKPHFEEMPTVAYRRYFKRFNVSFSRDLGTVDFREQDYYIYDKDESKGVDPHSIEVININPSYLGVMMQTGGDIGLMKKMVGPAIQQIMEQLTTLFPFLVIVGARHTNVLNLQFSQCISSVENNRTLALLTWSDSPTAPSDDFKYFLLSKDSDIPTNIPVEISDQLFDMNIPYSLLDQQPQRFQLWGEAQAGNKTSQDILQKKFQLNEFQMQRILDWFSNQVDDNLVFPFLQLILDPSPKTREDLGWIQWGYGTVNNDESITEGDFGQPLPGFPEIYFFGVRILKIPEHEFTFDGDLAKKVLNGTGVKEGESFSLFNPDNAIRFLKYFEEKDWSTIEKEFGGIDQKTANITGLYIHYIMDTFVDDVLRHQVFDKEIGLLTRKTIHEWAMEYTDPLLMLLQQPELAKKATLMINQTSEDEVYLTTGISTVNTGYYNLSWVGDFQRDDGIERLEIWNELVPIIGTDGTQFRPDLRMGDEIVIWFPQVLRPQNFTARQWIDHHGVQTLRFLLKEQMIEPNPIFNNDFWAMANMTVLGSPIFISNFHFLDSEPYWRDIVDGIKTPSDDDRTIVDVEPMTGLGMFERKRIQINAYVQNKTQWFQRYYEKTPTGVMYPLALVEEYIEINEEMAQQFKSTVYVIYYMRMYGSYISLGLSIVLLCVSLFLFYQYYHYRGLPKVTVTSSSNQ